MLDDFPFIMVVIFIFGVGSCTGCAVNEAYHRKPEVLSETPSEKVTVDRFDKLEERIVQMAGARCMTVNTPVLNVQVYDATNLGKYPVPKPDKKVQLEKPTN